MGVAFDIGVVALLISVAAWSIFAREAFSAIVIFMVYGLLLSLAWVRLGAVDVAMTEAAIGGGVTGMLLLNAAASLRGADAGTTPAGPPLPFAPLFLLIVFLIHPLLGGLVLLGIWIPLPPPRRSSLRRKLRASSTSSRSCRTDLIRVWFPAAWRYPAPRLDRTCCHGRLPYP